MKTDRATFIFDRIMFQGKDKLAFFIYILENAPSACFSLARAPCVIFGLTMSASTRASIISPPSNLHFLIFTSLENEKVLVWSFFIRKQSWISVLDKLNGACEDGAGHFSLKPWCKKKKNHLKGRFNKWNCISFCLSITLTHLNLCEILL